jgi:hypothetical protein
MNFTEKRVRMLELAKYHNIEIDRWEKDVDHHPEAVRIYGLLDESDWCFSKDYFGWKSGGDGDNGEILMYSLSILLELEEAHSESRVDDRRYPLRHGSAEVVHCVCGAWKLSSFDSKWRCSDFEKELAKAEAQMESL